MRVLVLVSAAVTIASGYGNIAERDVPKFGNSANKHLDRIANIPKYVNLNNLLDRDNFVNGTCLAWNQYIPYCSFCSAPITQGILNGLTQGILTSLSTLFPVIMTIPGGIMIPGGICSPLIVWTCWLCGGILQGQVG